jgi:pantoate--beta-alanine ligase
MSSRNNYLGADERATAGELHAVLLEVADRIRNGPGDWLQAEQDAKTRLELFGFRVDYIAVRRAEDLGRPEAADLDLRVLAAAYSGRTRLIDNVSAIRVGISGE